MRNHALALGVVSLAVAVTGVIAPAAQAVDSGPMKNCGKLGNIAKQVQTVVDCGEAREALTTFLAEGGRAAAAAGITCHWLKGNDKKVICTWDDKTRGGGSGAILYADALISASTSSGK
jgi:hypothetical protein